MDSEDSDKLLFNTISSEVDNGRCMQDDSDRDIGMKTQKFEEVRADLEPRLKAADGYFRSVRRL